MHRCRWDTGIGYRYGIRHGPGQRTAGYRYCPVIGMAKAIGMGVAQVRV